MSRQPRLYSLLFTLQRRLERGRPRRRKRWLGHVLRGVREVLFPRDFLTGLYYRAGFVQRLQAALDAGQRGAVLVIDVDHLKWFNDTCGHVDGDDYLRHLGRLVRDTTGGALAGRLGGDEFVVYVERGLQAEELAEQIRSRVEGDSRFEAMRAPVPHRSTPDYRGEHGCYGPALTVSIGVAHAEPGASLRELLETGDGAMSEAKAAGRNRVVRASRLLKIDG